jgi:translation initiation factor IF-2
MERRRIDNPRQAPAGKAQKLELVLKCDSAGSVEAVTTALSQIVVQGVEISIARRGIGAINKSDILISGTAGRLIIGFQVGIMQGLEKTLRDSGVDRLSEDLRMIAADIAASPAEEEVIGTGKVIALFKGTRKGIIVGCEVRDGFFAVGQRFRLISAMGPVYTGTIESLHIEERVVQKATRGQQVGIAIRNFSKAKVGDIVESFRPAPKKVRWEPKAGVVRIT